MNVAQLLQRYERADDVGRRRTLLRSLIDSASRGEVALGGDVDRLRGLRGSETDLEALALLRRLVVQAELHGAGPAAPPPLPLPTLAPTMPGGGLHDRYDLIDSNPYAWGGYGDIFQALRRSDDTMVAIKFLNAERADDARDRARFDREVDTLAYVDMQGGHPHVLPYFDHGEHEGRAWLATGWAESGSVAEVLRRVTPLPSELIALWLGQLLEGLDFLHRIGVVHRDLKPANLYLRTDPPGEPAIWIGDFGLALLGDRTRFTTEGSPSPGTPIYAPPEQRAGAQVQDLRVDLYSFGVVAFELWTGGRPMRGERSIRARGSEVPDAWEDVVRRCLDPERTLRPASAAEITAAVGAPRDDPR